MEMARHVVTVSALLAVVFVARAAVRESVITRDTTRYQYERGEGAPRLTDPQLKPSGVPAARYNPDTENVYHLFTRQNPSVSQPLLLGNYDLLEGTNYDPRHRTVLIIHGWQDSIAATLNTVLVPAFLAAEDVNVIALDWSTGASTTNYTTAMANCISSGSSAARFVTWLNVMTRSSVRSYHIIGYSLGAHHAGIVGRNLGGGVPYLTGLDPAFPGWITDTNRFSRTDAEYTEVISTNAGAMGFLYPLGDTNFYPNGGIGMPGCSSNICDHDRSFYYLAESLVSGGFESTRCASYLNALNATCDLLGGLTMGGILPKTGSTGVFYLETNAAPPFSRG